MRGASVSGFVQRGTSLEPAAPDLGDWRTPIEDFFVCKVGEPARPEVESWRLSVDGDAVAQMVELRLADLQRLPQHRVDAWLECAGNGRSLFGLVGPKPVADDANRTPWMLGAMGMARWEGPALQSVLDLAGIDSDASWVSPAGLDFPNDEGEPVRMCLPLGKALDADTIVALKMNDAPLEPLHGAPARLRSPDGADLGPATAHPVKSSLALPWPGQLDTGPHSVAGYARVGEGDIARVEWSVDGGRWRDAELMQPDGPWAWRPFRFEWNAPVGSYVIRTRATDDRGNRQPEQMPFHPDGLLWNAVIPHPVLVG